MREDKKYPNRGSRSQTRLEATQTYVGSGFGRASIFRGAVPTLNDWPSNWQLDGRFTTYPLFFVLRAPLLCALDLPPT